MNQNTATINRPGILVLVTGFIALIVIIFIFNRPPFFDEEPYLQNVTILHQFGFSKAYLMNLTGSAGPLYSTVHYLLEPISRLDTPNIRFINILFLLGVTLFISRSLLLLRFSDSKYALVIMAIPMTYVVSGLALTEMPAMFFLALGIYLVIKALNANTQYIGAMIMAMAAGICMSLAILGRQPYLLILVALPILFYNKKDLKKSTVLLVITLLFSLALPCFVFLAWNGLVAPYDASLYASLANKGILYRPELFLLCLAYYAIIFVLIAPEFYILPSKRELLILITCFALIVILNHKFEFIRFLPLKTVLAKLLPSYQLMDTAEKLVGSILAITGIYFLMVLVQQLYKAAYRKDLVFYAIAIVAIAVSCIKLTFGFSSRYAAQAIPLLIPLAAYFYRNTLYVTLRLIIGVVIGMMSILSFYLS